jgi:hypothetical protein
MDQKPLRRADIIIKNARKVMEQRKPLEKENVTPDSCSNGSSRRACRRLEFDQVIFDILEDT